MNCAIPSTAFRRRNVVAETADGACMKSCQSTQDRNHKLSRRLVAAHQTIVWSKIGHTAIAKTFGKSLPVLDTLNFEHAGLQVHCKAVGSSSKFPRSFHQDLPVCGSLSGPLATQAVM